MTAAAINGDGVALGRGALVTDAIERGELVKPFDLVAALLVRVLRGVFARLGG